MHLGEEYRTLVRGNPCYLIVPVSCFVVGHGMWLGESDASDADVVILED